MEGVEAVMCAEQEEEKREATNPRMPVVVTFPGAARRRTQSFPSPLRWESEQATGDMSPRNAWHVYAFGGFMILTWIWARWKERKNRRIPDED